MPIAFEDGNVVPEYRRGDYVRVEVVPGVTHPISVWIRVEYCDKKCGIIYGTVDDDEAERFSKALRSGPMVAATYLQVRERRAS
jgi:hypothetical protein